MNLFERTILGVSPRWAARRARERLMAREMLAFEAARVGRRNRDVTRADAGPNAQIGPALYRLRASARRLIRDNPYAERAVDILTSHRVGYGFTPRARTGDLDLDRDALKVWNTWAARADVTGILSFNGLLELQARAWAGDGEGVLRLVRYTGGQMRSRDLFLPLQLEGVEADFVDETRNETIPGGLIVQGIEQRGGRREAFWMHRTHPGEAWGVGWQGPLARNQVDRWPAKEVLHLFTPKRFGQQHGYPIFAPVNLRLQRLDEFEDASLEKAKIEACLAAFVTTPAAPGEGTVTAGAEGSSRGEERYREEQLSPGMINYLEPGEDIETVEPSGAGQFSPLAMHFLMSIAVGVGVTYDQLTGDLSGATFSSLKAGKIEFRRGIDRDHELRLIPMVCNPIWAAVMDAAVIAGRLPYREGGYPVEWMPPRHEMIDPTREIPALIKSVRAGFETMPQAIASFGYDPRAQVEEIRNWNKDVDQHGVILDTDPRRSSLAGTAQDPRANSAVELGARDRNAGGED